MIKIVLQEFIQWVLRLFGKKPIREKDVNEAHNHETAYENIKDINFAAIFGNALANKTIAKSTVDVVGKDDKNNKRSEFINHAIQNIWRESKKITAQAVGKGGKVIVPYISGGRPYFDIVDQSRLYITNAIGNEIYSASIIADMQMINERRFYRWADYTLKDGNHIIRNRATNESGGTVALASIEAWSGISEEIIIGNVDRLLIGFFKNTTDNRRDKEYYGVPITYGCEHIIEEIKEHLKLIQREYKLMRPMVGLDSTLWNDPNTKETVQDKDKPFVKLFNGSKDDKSLWEIYAPAIRDSAMLSRLKELYERLEKAVGTSKGILTEQTTTNATATEILHGQYDTFCLVESLRTEWEEVMEDLAYAYDVFAEFYGLTPAGGRNSHKIIWDWDMRLTENSTEKYNQLSDLHSKGGLWLAELRQHEKGGTIEENQAVVDAIKESEPTLNQLMGIE